MHHFSILCIELEAEYSTFPILQATHGGGCGEIIVAVARSRVEANSL